MKIFPAIDIKDKKCVRLIKGDFDNKTEYNMSPIEQAGKYKDHGFKNLHIVDLDGALTGETVNLDIIKDIVDKFNLKIEVGGGIRNFNAGAVGFGLRQSPFILEYAYLANQIDSPFKSSCEFTIGIDMKEIHKLSKVINP